MTHAMVIMDRFRSVERNSSTTSMEMKLGMGEAMKGKLPTGRRGNTRCQAIEAAAGIRADTTRPLPLTNENPGLKKSRPGYPISC
jgi:hypothetical protein